MLINSRIENSRSNGPGARAVLWTAGCSLRCPGCWNPETHAFSNSKETDVYGLVDWVLSIEGIEGVTLSGGEPFQQAPALFLFVTLLKERRPDFSIGAYSGYTLEQLKAGRWKWKSAYNSDWVKGTGKLAEEILGKMDFLIAGRFVQELVVNDKPLCGSANQQVHFLSDRYTDADLQQNTVELIIDPKKNTIQITGFPPEDSELVLA